MMLTTRGRYAVMAISDMIINHNQETPITLQNIAERQQIPLNYLEQIFAKLRKNNIVISFKGPGGGYKIERELNKISVADIIHAVEETIKITRCDNKDNGGCMSNQAQCLTHDLWESLGKKIESYLSSITLADLKEGKIAI